MKHRSVRYVADEPHLRATQTRLEELFSGVLTRPAVYSGAIEVIFFAPWRTHYIPFIFRGYKLIPDDTYD